MKYSSFWLDLPYQARPALAQDLETDVVVIGGGITGVSAAYHAAKAGFRTVLLEKNMIASGSAGKNGGMVVEGLSEDLFESIASTSPKKAVATWNRTKASQALVKRLIINEGIDCDFTEVGSMYVGKTAVDRPET